MTQPWQAYQEEVAAFFRSLGLSTSMEAEVKGVRATHRADVLVCFDLVGVKVIWIVECKLWRTPVPKEKVLVLHHIAQDVGADRAFLFSETSFQPGAVSAARSTNISLTSLAEMRETVRVDLAQLQLRTVLTRLTSLERSARSGFTDENGALRRANPESFDESIYLAGVCLFLERAAVRGLVDDFPVYVTGVDTSKTPEFSDAPELAAFLLGELDEIDRRLSLMDGADRELPLDTVSFVRSVRTLLDASQEVLTRLSPSNEDIEAKRFECVSLMKATGQASESLCNRGGRQFQEARRDVMRNLFDTVYRDLAKLSVSEADWLISREGTERRLLVLEAVVDASGGRQTSR